MARLRTAQTMPAKLQAARVRSPSSVSPCAEHLLLGRRTHAGGRALPAVPGVATCGVKRWPATPSRALEVLKFLPARDTPGRARIDLS